MIGSRLAHYEITAHLGSGGMGEVYQATDSKLGRSVAIKILPEAFARDAARVARFEREARVLASLNHPHIAAIHGFEESSGRNFLVMELVGGETLAERIVRGPLPLDEAVPIAMQIAEALEAAHDKGVIHRDLKPANIKVTPEGQVKVLDFGLAKAFNPDAERVNLSNSPTLSTAATNAGVILGTAAYMSPEQAKGSMVDRRSDIFSFGCLLYEMLTGHQAFQGETVSDVLANVLRAEPDWSGLPPDVPSAFRRLLRKCLQKDRNWRLQNAGDVRIEISDARTEPDTGQPAAAGVRRSGERRAWIMVVAVLLALAVTFGVPYFRAPVEPSEMRLEVMTPSTMDPISLAISPDGRKVVFVASGDGASRLWLRPLDSATTQPLAGTEGAAYPFWSPDSRSVGFFAETRLKRIDIGGGLPQTLAAAPAARGGTWGLDGMIVFAPTSAGPLLRVLSTGGETMPVTRIDPPRHIGHRFPSFLPDGRQFLFFAQGPPESQGIYLGSLDSPETIRLTVADTAGIYTPGGWVIFVAQASLVARRLDRSRRELIGDPVTVANSVTIDPTFNVGAFSVSSTGTVAYRSGGAGRRQFAWFDRSGKLLSTIGEPDEFALTAPALSPDGTRVAAMRTVQGNTDIWLFDAARTIRFTFDGAFDRFPRWSPDGTRIVFESNRKGHRDLYLKPSDSAGAEVLLMESAEDKAPVSWSPDGRFLLYNTPNNPKTGSDIWVFPMDGDRKPFIFLQTNFEERLPVFSPDGRWIAYQSNESGQYQIYMRPFPGPGGQWQVSTGGGIQPKWRRDGKEVYYLAPDGKLMAVPIAVKGSVFEPAAPVPLFLTRIWGGGSNATNGWQYDIAPDGRFLINVTTEDAVASHITLLLNWKPLL